MGSDAFQGFCDALTAGGAGSTIGLVRMYGLHPRYLYENKQKCGLMVCSPAEVVNYGKYIKDTVVAQCPAPEGTNGAPDVEDCFGTSDDSKFQDDDLTQTWRLWLFQVCTQWGYFMPAPLEGPSIVSSK